MIDFNLRKVIDIGSDTSVLAINTTSIVPKKTKRTAITATFDILCKRILACPGSDTTNDTAALQQTNKFEVQTSARLMMVGRSYNNSLQPAVGCKCVTCDVGSHDMGQASACSTTDEVQISTSIACSLNQ